MPITQQTSECRSAARYRAESPLDQCYARAGVTPATVRNRIEQFATRGYLVEDFDGQMSAVELKRHHEPSHCARYHSDLLYVNSSDSFDNLYQGTEINDQPVLTVAGSGDLALAFIDRGAACVDVRDVSAPGLFLTELKLVAAAKLNYREYCTMFGTIYDNSDLQNLASGEVEIQRPIFDKAPYLRLRDSLSACARTYFDTVLEPQHEPMHSIKGEVGSEGKVSFVRHNFKALVRYRSMDFGDTLCMADRLPFLRDAEAYGNLQAQLERAHWTLGIADLSKQPEDLAKYGLVYSSNTGYDKHLDVIRKLVAGGAARVAFTAYSPREHLGDTDCSSLEHSEYSGYVFERVAIDLRCAYGIYAEFSHAANSSICG